MSDQADKKDAEQWAEDWAAEAESAALRARQYAELAKRHVATALALNRQSRRLTRLAICILGGLVITQLTALGFAVAGWRSR